MQAVQTFIYAIKHTAKVTWDIDIKAKALLIDHGDALKNGFGAVFPDAALCTDWPHIAHKIKNTRAKEIKNEDNRNFFKLSLDVLHMCRTKEQFMQIAKWVGECMAARGERAFWQTFAKEYCTDTWCGWYYQAVRILGFTPATQALESYNKTIKLYKLWRTRASLAW
jgi:hypothetical protein